MKNRRQLLAQSAALLFGATGIKLATISSSSAAKNKVFEGSTPGVAINGYDPVAYFTEQKPVQGSHAFSTEWKGSKWHFSSAKNRDKFIGNPETYAPQFGGYCAYAVSRGYTAKTEPDAWSVVDGKLYLNYSKSVRSLWETEIPANISKANKNWPNVLGQ